MLQNKIRREISMYTILDVIDRIIEIEEKSLEFYKMLKKSPNVAQRVKLTAGVFIREETRHIEIYENIKKDVENLDNIQIDFHIYDSVSKLISEFKKSLSYFETNDVKSLLNSALDFEQKNLALVIRIQGLIVTKKEDVENNSYKVLTRIIQEEEKHIELLKTFIK